MILWFSSFLIGGRVKVLFLLVKLIEVFEVLVWLV